MAAVVPGADLTPTRPRGVATRSTRAIGALAAVLFAWVLVGGLGFTPAEEQQGESRLFELHRRFWFGHSKIVNLVKKYGNPNKKS